MITIVAQIYDVIVNQLFVYFQTLSFCEMIFTLITLIYDASMFSLLVIVHTVQASCLEIAWTTRKYKFLYVVSLGVSSIDNLFLLHTHNSYRNI